MRKRLPRAAGPLEQADELGEPPLAEVSELAAIEARLAQLSREVGEIRAALADPALYDSADRRKLAELSKAEARLASALAHAEEDWLHASARLEALRAAPTD